MKEAGRDPEDDPGREEARAQALAELAAGVAHEVNNPLAGVMNYALLARRYPPGDPRLAEALDGIVAEARRIQELTRALATYARRGAEPQPLAPADLVRAALAPVRRQLREELVTVAVDVPDGLPAVLARGAELQRALLHLLAAARAALGARFPGRDPAKVLTIRGRHDPAVVPPVVVLEVEDAGTAPAGDAVGTARAAAVARTHGGRLEVERAGAGTIARLTLPAA